MIMHEYTPEQLQARFDSLPEEMQQAISSPGVHDKIRAVGEKHGLMIDQIGGLVEQVGLIMLGLARSSDFVRDASVRLAVDNRKAREIAGDINLEVFGSIKEAMMAAQRAQDSAPAEESHVESRAEAISSMSSAGGIEIEPEPAEKPLSHAWKASSPVNKINSAPTTEPLVDQLLGGSVSAPEEKIEVKAPLPLAPVAEKAMPTPNVQPPANLPTNDPYREAVK